MKDEASIYQLTLAMIIHIFVDELRDIKKNLSSIESSLLNMILRAKFYEIEPDFIREIILEALAEIGNKYE